MNMYNAIENLTRAAQMGNGQSYYQLYLIHSCKEGQSQVLQDPIKAYGHLMNAIFRGATFFDEAVTMFKDNYDALVDNFISTNGLIIQKEDTEESRNNIIKTHDAFINELKSNFSSALSKDRLYNRPCGFLND